MMQAKNESRPFWLTVIVFTFLISLYAALSTYARAGEAGIALQRSIWGGMLLVYSATAVACIWLFVRVAQSGELQFQGFSFSKNIQLDRPGWRAAGWIVFVLILIRLSPAIPFAATNFVVWASGISFPIFAAGTVIGMLPRATAVVFVGASLSELDFDHPQQTWLIILGIIATILAVVLISIIARKAVRRIAGAD